jgi:hypothetical protein
VNVSWKSADQYGRTAKKIERAFREGTSVGNSVGRRRQRYSMISTDISSRAEIMQALKEMKNNKAAKIDGIPVKILKADLNVIAASFS